MGVAHRRSASVRLLRGNAVTLTAFLHGYPPLWSMGGEMSTHRTLKVVPGSVVFTSTPGTYEMDGVTVMPGAGESYVDIAADAEAAGASVLYAHSSMSRETVRAARRMHLPSVLAVHAPRQFGKDLRRAWSAATKRLYNTEVARKDWHDPKGWLLHPPVGGPSEMPEGPHDALTLTSSLLNKGAARVLNLAENRSDQRFIIVESPAHPTHGSPEFWEQAAELDNVEVWPRLHPSEMGKLWAETRILLVPSRYETYGMSAMEAAWHGIPSVHVNTPHVLEGIGTAARLLRSTTVTELDTAVSDVEDQYDLWAEAAFDRVNSLAKRESEELARFAAGVAALTPA